jgi:hypothetical protein
METSCPRVASTASEQAALAPFAGKLAHIIVSHRVV